MTFIEKTAPGTKRKLQKLDGTLGLNPSHLIVIAFKVYSAREAKKIQQAMCSWKRGWQNQKKRGDTKGKERGPLGTNQ